MSLNKYYLGIDGGGTKTRFGIADENGNIVKTFLDVGISYKQYSEDTICRRLKSAALHCFELFLAYPDVISIGFPCYGENKEQDIRWREILKRLLAPSRVLLFNDVEIAYEGALSGKPGIHVVCGTGSIAYGKNSDGTAERCGGWSERFGDEGSGYWLGLEAMRSFTMEADGRLPRGALYRIFREKLQLKDDTHFISRMENDYLPYRDKVASLQLCLLQAADEGDKSAQALYKRAVSNLTEMVGALKKRLKLPKSSSVTYSGSIFKAEALVLKPFIASVSKKTGCFVIKPMGGPLEGAARLAVKGKGEKYG